MKLPDTTTIVAQIGNITGEAQFKMKTSRKAFQILSDLYSDKPLAIVRELGCNASDSMIDSGNGDKPFHIHLPNSLEPWIIIEDFGTGISDENIYNIYSVYFESTKTNSDSQIGCLGLGSKSPFCYADNFIITSIFKGEKRIYNAFFNANNTPAISLMSTEVTSHANGVAIQIPVKNKDFELFEDATRKAFRFFKVKPTITGTKFDWKIETPIFSTDDWDSYEKLGYNEAYAIMGGVAYPIDAYKLDDKHRQFVQKSGLVLKFAMGELDFTPSRESLSYCTQTLKALNNKVDKVIKDFNVKLSELIADKTNIFDAINGLSVLKSKFTNIQSMCFDNIEWNGVDISNSTQLILKITNNVKPTTHHYSTYGRSKYRESSQITFSTDTTWYYDDLVRGSESRIKHHLKNNQDARMCVFPMDAYTALTTNSNDTLRFDKSSFTPISSLAKAVKVITYTNNGSAPVARSGFKIYTIGDNWKDTWYSKDFNAANPPKFYIVKATDSFTFSVSTANIGTYSDKSDIRKLAEVLGLNEYDIVIVSKNNAKHLEANGIPSLEDHIKTLSFVYDANDVATALKYDERTMNEYFKHPSFKELATDHPFAKFITNVRTSFKKVSKYDHILNLLPSKGEAYEIESACPVLNLMVSKMYTYQWDAKSILLVIKNLKDFEN